MHKHVLQQHLPVLGVPNKAHVLHMSTEAEQPEPDLRLVARGMPQDCLQERTPVSHWHTTLVDSCEQNDRQQRQADQSVLLYQASSLSIPHFAPQND